MDFSIENPRAIVVPNSMIDDLKNRGDKSVSYFFLEDRNIRFVKYHVMKFIQDRMKTDNVRLGNIIKQIESDMYDYIFDMEHIRNTRPEVYNFIKHLSNLNRRFIIHEYELYSGYMENMNTIVNERADNIYDARNLGQTYNKKGDCNFCISGYPLQENNSLSQYDADAMEIMNYKDAAFQSLIENPYFDVAAENLHYTLQPQKVNNRTAMSRHYENTKNYSGPYNFWQRPSYNHKLGIEKHSLRDDYPTGDKFKETPIYKWNMDLLRQKLPSNYDCAGDEPCLYNKLDFGDFKHLA
jgi:hypothetical protein